MRSNKNPVALCDTVNYTNDEWANGLRKHGPAYKNPADPNFIPVCIGGSDCAVIFGDSPWKSKLELYHEKSGTATPKYVRKMPQDLLDAGHILEDFVAMNFRNYMEKVAGIPAANIEIRNDTIMYQHPDYPFALVNLDRRIWVNGVPGILEIKTTGNWTDIAKWKQGTVPKKYEWQCRYYMATMNLDYCYIACMWGYSIDEMAVIKIDRDKAIEDTMMEEIAEFVECCEMGIEPEEQTTGLPVLSKYYERLYGIEKNPKSTIDLPENEETMHVAELAMEISDRRAEIEKLQKVVDEMEAKITTVLMKYGQGKGQYMNLRIDENTVLGMAIKPTFHKDGFDEERFKNDHPAEYAEFLKTETTTKFDLAGLKKKYKKGELDIPSYKIPGELDTDKPVKLGKVELKDIPIQVASPGDAVSAS